MTLKEQALKHWRENKRRFKAMYWKEWRNLPFSMRRNMLFRGSRTVPCIGGEYCPFCQYYSEHCYVTTELTVVRCPLYDISLPGQCCKEWRFVREALLHPTTKSVASRAINRMIKRLEAINE